MKKLSIMLFIIIAITLMSCSTIDKNLKETPQKIDSTEKTALIEKPAQTVDDISIETYPIDNSFIIAAVSPRFQSNDDEVKFVMASAARQISIYYGAYISYKKLIDENIIGTIQAQQIDVVYDENLALSFLDKLEIIKESSGHDYYAALIKMDRASLPEFPSIEINPQVKPSWINNPPQFDGYITGVGVSGRRKSVYESWEQADKLAMAEIANSISTNIQSGTATIERGGASSSVSTSVIKTFTVSDVNLKGLYIISRWRESDNRTYYSLAISRKS